MINIPPQNLQLYKHVTTGTVYMVLVGAAHAEWRPELMLTVYQSTKDGTVWVRPLAEFCDGRFVEA